MAIHTNLPIYKVAYDLLDVVTSLVKNMNRDFKRSIGDKISTECIEITVLIFRANVYLDVLDQFVKHGLRCKHYIRYVDDFVLLHESAQWLNEAKYRIEQLLANQLDSHINPGKTILQPIARGIDFVGQVIKPWRRTLRRRTFNEAISRIRKLPSDDVLETGNSYFGLLRQSTNSHHDRAMLSNELRRRGHTVAGNLTKIYRRSI